MGCMQSTPVTEPVAAAPPASNKSATEAAAAPAPESQTAEAPAATEPEAEASAEPKAFAVNGVSITEQGIVYYHIEAADGSVSIKRRYNDFKALYAQLSSPSGLPPLPEAAILSLLRGRHSQQVMKERETQFAVILNAIANKPAVAESAAFKKFLA